MPALPPIRWDRFAARIADSIANSTAEEDRPALYPMPWVRRWSMPVGGAIAAVLLLAVGINLRISTHRNSPAVRLTRSGQLVVDGPVAEAPVGAVVQQIAIGPSAAVAAAGGDAIRYGDSGVVVPTQRVVIASDTDAAQDTNQDSPSTPY
ncbi:MAG: anti-sigma factor [Phycisphaerae bacterium]|nr:anti-sigma factor [Phycisphaerae bacterium]